MDGLMMDFPLTLDVILRRAETIHAEREVATRLPDKRWHRYCYAEMAARAKRLSLALKSLGVVPGDRVATLCWNHFRHFEAYFGVPISGAVLHTLNLRLHPDELSYIVNQANDKVLIVDQSLLGILEEFRGQINPEHVIVVPESGEDRRRVRGRTNSKNLGDQRRVEDMPGVLSQPMTVYGLSIEDTHLLHTLTHHAITL